MKVKVYSSDGKSKKDIELPENIFGLPLNKSLVHQVVVSMMSNQRVNIAHTKNRGEVSGGGKKPWKQKGTGRARVGSSRSPIWRGGGVTFGPRNERNFKRKINQKQKTTALFQILSQKLRDGEIIFVDDISFKEPKTQEAKKVLENLSEVKGFEQILAKKKNASLIANANEKDDNFIKSFSNFSNISVEEFRKINPLEVLRYKYLVIVNPEEGLKTLEAKIK